MQLKSLLLGALPPLGLMANPAAEAKAAADADVSIAGGPLDPRAIVRPQHCQIVGGSSTVNCRSGPGTKYGVKLRLRKGTTYDFWCVQSAECVTINGFRNCGWHYSKQHRCFVSGHYTDNRCTLARMGTCDWRDDDDLGGKPF